MTFALSKAVEAVAPSLSTADQRVLGALLYAPDHAASAGQLRTVLGLSAVVQVNGAIGRIGRKVHSVLGAHPEGLEGGEFEWWHVIATGRHTSERGFVWKLRDEVVAGLLACGYLESGDTLPNEVFGEDLFVEGAVRHVTVNAYERNPVARARCIEVYGAACTVCGIDFGAVYGPQAAGYIHVHHIKTLASIGAQYEVNPIEDLRPVCPNCHAVIHMTNPPRSIDEVRALLFERATPNQSFQPTASGGS